MSVATEPWDESTRPTYMPPEPDRRYTPEQLANSRHLVEVHDHLRAELTRVRDLVTQVGSGAMDAGAARSMINTMTMRQNNWTLGAYCASYCRVVTMHHTIEDASMFPRLQQREPALAPVLDRLQAEHHVIAALLDEVDQSLVALVAEPEGIDRLRTVAERLEDAMNSHLAYEEGVLADPLARFGFF